MAVSSDDEESTTKLIYFDSENGLTKYSNDTERFFTSSALKELNKPVEKPEIKTDEEDNPDTDSESETERDDKPQVEIDEEDKPEVETDEEDSPSNNEGNSSEKKSEKSESKKESKNRNYYY